MAEEKNDQNSFAKRFARKNSSSESDSGGSFASKYSSGNTKEQALGIKGKISELTNRAASEKKDFSDVKRFIKKSSTNESASGSGAVGSFADAIQRSRLDLIYLVRGKDGGRAAWHYVLVDKDKREMFLAKSRTGSMDVKDYGQILCSGWGDYPPQSVTDKIGRGEFTLPSSSESDSEEDDFEYDENDFEDDESYDDEIDFL